MEPRSTRIWICSGGAKGSLGQPIGEGFGSDHTQHIGCFLSDTRIGVGQKRDHGRYGGGCGRLERGNADYSFGAYFWFRVRETLDKECEGCLRLRMLERKQGRDGPSSRLLVFSAHAFDEGRAHGLQESLIALRRDPANHLHADRWRRIGENESDRVGWVGSPHEKHHFCEARKLGRG